MPDASGGSGMIAKSSTICQKSKRRIHMGAHMPMDVMLARTSKMPPTNGQFHATATVQIITAVSVMAPPN